MIFSFETPSPHPQTQYISLIKLCIDACTHMDEIWIYYHELHFILIVVVED